MGQKLTSVAYSIHKSPTDTRVEMCFIYLVPNSCILLSKRCLRVCVCYSVYQSKDHHSRRFKVFSNFQGSKLERNATNQYQIPVRLPRQP